MIPVNALLFSLFSSLFCSFSSTSFFFVLPRSKNPRRSPIFGSRVVSLAAAGAGKGAGAAFAFAVDGDGGGAVLVFVFVVVGGGVVGVVVVVAAVLDVM